MAVSYLVDYLVKFNFFPFFLRIMITASTTQTAMPIMTTTATTTPAIAGAGEGFDLEEAPDIAASSGLIAISEYKFYN